MSDGIVKQLREEELRLGRAAFDSADAGLSCNVAMEAADEIERLTAELAAERDMKLRMTSACEDMQKVAEKYKAELAAERERYAGLFKEHESMKSGFDVASDILGDNIAKLREALERCVEQLEAYDRGVPEIARAALAETGGDGEKL
jgi:hypothetical protein